MGDGYDRRRTGFERDLREFVLKLVLGLIAGGVLSVLVSWDGQWWVPFVIGVFGMFGFAYLIQGSSRHQDDR